MERDIYFKDRSNNDYTKYTKEEIRDMIDPFKPETFIPILKDMNYPYFESEWGNTLRHSCKGNNIKSTIGKYTSKMRLKGFQPYTFKDSQYHKCLQEFDFTPYGLFYNKETGKITIFKDLLPKWDNSKNEKEIYIEIIKYLLSGLEEEHLGISKVYKQLISNKWNLDF